MDNYRILILRAAILAMQYRDEYYHGVFNEIYENYVQNNLIGLRKLSLIKWYIYLREGDFEKAEFYREIYFTDRKEDSRHTKEVIQS